MMIVHSNAVDPLRPMLVRGLETSEGSIPSIGLGRVRTPYDTFFISRYRPRPDSYQMLDSEAVRYRLSGIAHYKFRKAL